MAKKQAQTRKRARPTTRAAAKKGAKVKKAAARKPASGKKGTVRKPTKAAAKKPATAMARLGWLDEQSQTPIIDRYARQLGSFIEAMADGTVDEAEVKSQEARLVKLMKEIEPQLDDALHAKITRLLCELTAYDIMQILHSMHQARPKTVFQG
jgi:hypothetical protein